jgi:hypothetical protein
MQKIIRLYLDKLFIHSTWDAIKTYIWPLLFGGGSYVIKDITAGILFFIGTSGIIWLIRFWVEEIKDTIKDLNKIEDKILIGDDPQINIDTSQLSESIVSITCSVPIDNCSNQMIDCTIMDDTIIIINGHTKDPNFQFSKSSIIIPPYSKGGIKGYPISLDLKQQKNKNDIAIEIITSIKYKHHKELPEFFVKKKLQKKFCRTENNNKITYTLQN